MTSPIRTSLAARIDPLAKLVWLLLVGVSSSLLIGPSPLLGVTAFVCLTFLLCRWDELAQVYKYKIILLLVPSLLIFFNAIMVPIYSNAWHIGEIKWSAISYSIKIFNSILALVFFLISTDVRQLVDRLTQMGVPVGAAFSIYLMLRFMDILRVDARYVRDALRMRRANKTLLGSSRLFGRYVATLVLLGIYRSEQAAMAMDLRGFSTAKRRTFFGDHPWSLAGWLLPLLGSALILVLALVDRSIICPSPLVSFLCGKH
jgi:energy-coupling factor transporter transmembrane protein EcfT